MFKVISDTPGCAFGMLWAVPLLFAWNAGAAAVAGDGEDIEEVVVTGSYLKRSAADSPSPLSVVTRRGRFVFSTACAQKASSRLSSSGR